MSTGRHTLTRNRMTTLPQHGAGATHGPRDARRRCRTRGFSLLEVMLALAILGGAIVVLGEAGRFALENARVARDLATAQLLCETKLAELACGMERPDAVQGAFLAEGNAPGAPAWLYFIETATIDQQGLLAVQVTVSQDLPPEKRPIECTLVRWMIDPEIELLWEEASAASEEAAGGGASSSSSGSASMESP